MDVVCNPSRSCGGGLLVFGRLRAAAKRRLIMGRSGNEGGLRA